MGIDLVLLPLDHDSKDLAFSHTIIRLNRDSDLFERIKRLCPTALPSDHGVSAYVAVVPDGSYKGESCYGTLVSDSYGDPYTWVTAGQLCGVFGKNAKPAWTVAYVMALPASTRIILHWC